MYLLSSWHSFLIGSIDSILNRFHYFLVFSWQNLRNCRRLTADRLAELDRNIREFIRRFASFWVDNNLAVKKTVTVSLDKMLKTELTAESSVFVIIWLPPATLKISPTTSSQIEDASPQHRPSTLTITLTRVLWPIFTDWRVWHR